MHRFLIAPDSIRGSTVLITDPHELRHIQRVLRLRVGDPICCFDGRGSEYSGRIEYARPSEIVVTIQQRVVLDGGQPGAAIWLAASLIKPDRFEWMIQKSTELGVNRISPIVASRTVARPDAGRQTDRQRRWQRIAQEAAKQCGRSRLPDLDSPQPVAKLLAVAELPRLILIPTLAVAARPIKDVLAELTSRPRKKTAGGSGFGAVGSGQKLFSDGDCLPGPQPRTPNPEPTGVFQQSAGSNEVLILIGPEGDFAPAEIELARSRGARPVSLGPWTLRAETAAVVSVAVVQYALARAA